MKTLNNIHKVILMKIGSPDFFVWLPRKVSYQMKILFSIFISARLRKETDPRIVIMYSDLSSVEVMVIYRMIGNPYNQNILKT